MGNPPFGGTAYFSVTPELPREVFVKVPKNFNAVMKSYFFVALALLVGCTGDNPVDPEIPVPDPIIFAPATHPIVFSSFRDETYGARNLEVLVTKTDGSEFINLSRNAASDTDPSWSPDGQTIAFASDRNGNFDIYLMAKDGSNVRRLTFDTVDERHPRWSPDGEKIIFESPRDGLLPGDGRPRYNDLFVIDADASHVFNLTKTPTASETSAAWSPNGQTIAFNRGGRIMLIDAAGGNERALHEATNDFIDDVPAWSPDGSRLAYSAFNVNHPFATDTWVIFTIKPDGTENQRITGLGYSSARFPSWSPDGTKILHNRDNVDEWWGRFSTQNLWIMNADGSSLVRVTSDPSNRNELGGPQAWTK